MVALCHVEIVEFAQPYLKATVNRTAHTKVKDFSHRWPPSPEHQPPPNPTHADGEKCILCEVSGFISMPKMVNMANFKSHKDNKLGRSKTPFFHQNRKIAANSVIMPRDQCSSVNDILEASEDADEEQTPFLAQKQGNYGVEASVSI